MFSKSKFVWVFVAPLALAALLLAGCDSGADRFAKLDSTAEEDAAHVGLLVPHELDHNNDNLITPEELQGAKTYARSVDEFFADGKSAQDRELTPEEFKAALLGKRMPTWQVALIALAVVVIPIPIGIQIAKSLRMPDYGWQIALILVSITAGAAVAGFGWPPKRGIDLSGGIILVYEIDEEATREQLGGEGEEEEAAPVDQRAEITSKDVAPQLRRRINPGGVSEIIVRPYGPQQVEIIIPNVEEAEVEYYKRLIERTGQLEFFIVANSTDHQDLITQAEDNVASTIRILANDKGETIGRWVPVGQTQATQEERPNYRGIDLNDTLRARRGASKEFELVDTLKARPLVTGEKPNFKQAFDQLGYRDLQALMVVNAEERFNVKGQHLRDAGTDADQVGRPAVRFRMTGSGARLLGLLTSQNQPDPATGFHRRMAIIMDNEVMSAPRLLSPISSSGQITGDFSADEVKELVGVLNAGRLPAVMRKDPISQNQVSSLLGADTIRKGSFAIGLSLIVVLFFMMIYYRFAGIVACCALVINLVLILALMILIKATFTLPGIAGLVLTVGMSVDANVLVFERIREELSRGAALRMAIRNGFQRATTTIVDANLTTLITAIVLYVIGTDQIRGFAVTLILGILMSMYTAIFCSRVVFDIAERKRWITKLSMMHIVGATHINFFGRRKLAAAMSIILILVGMGALITRGPNILDIDFLGGTSVQLLFKEPKAIAEVRERAENGDLGDVSVVGVPLGGDANGDQTETKTGEYLSFIINSSITGEEPPDVGDPVKYTPPGKTIAGNYTVTAVDVEGKKADLESATGQTAKAVAWDDIDRDGVAVVKKRVMELFGKEMQFRSMTVDKLAAVGDAEPQPPADDTPEVDNTTPTDPATTGEPSDGSDPSGEPPAVEPEPTGERSPEESGATPRGESFSFVALQDEQLLAQAPPESNATERDTAAADSTEPAADDGAGNDANDDSGADEAEPPTTDDAPATDDASPSGVVDELPETTAAIDGRTRATLSFDHAMTASNVRELIRDAIIDKYTEIDLPRIGVSNAEWDGASGERFAEWDVEIPLSEAATQSLLKQIETEQAGLPVWLSSNKIGGQVAGNLQQQAVAALLASLLGIIGYIWFRFQRVVFGLAAVVALVHDVLITLGAIALSMWIAKATMGVLLIDEFKISLPIVAALLTIIGYSLNDTIVVFDRIREVRGKNPDLTQDMINTSINQTLGRTLLTSTTTLIVVTLLYVLGGQAIRGFAFALLVGVMVGTYSSIFVASPCLLWMINATKESKQPAAKGVPAGADSP